MIVIATFLIVLAVDKLFRIRQSNVVLRHQFRLYALRDELRELAMRGEVKPTNWVFLYLDSSIAKTINTLPNVSLWRVIVMMIFSPRDPVFNVRMEHLHKELKKSENEALAKIYLHYVAEMGVFITNRHDSLLVIIKCLFGVLNSRKWLKEKTRLAKEVLTVAPETSTLPEFCAA